MRPWRHLIAGHRRLEAVKHLNWDTMPVCAFGSLTAHECRLIELEENIRRKDLTEAERSIKIVELAETVRDVAQAEAQNQSALEVKFLRSTRQPAVRHFRELEAPSIERGGNGATIYLNYGVGWLFDYGTTLPLEDGRRKSSGALGWKVSDNGFVTIRLLSGWHFGAFGRILC